MKGFSFRPGWVCWKHGCHTINPALLFSWTPVLRLLLGINKFVFLHFTPAGWPWAFLSLQKINQCTERNSFLYLFPWKNSHNVSNNFCLLKLNINTSLVICFRSNPKCCKPASAHQCMQWVCVPTNTCSHITSGDQIFMLRLLKFQCSAHSQDFRNDTFIFWGRKFRPKKVLCFLKFWNSLGFS